MTMQAQVPKTRRTLMSVTLLAVLALPSFASSATAAPPKCDGRTVTKARFIGTNGPDVIVGTPGNDVIVGRGGDDTIDGRGGRDRICGGSGVDAIFGGGGRDRLFGGKGGDAIDGEGGSDRIHGDRGNDELSGNGGADVIFGGRGNDRIFGMGGRDRLYGGSHKDDIFGGPGDDVLRGNSGVDSLDGGADIDDCKGAGSAGQIVRCEDGADLGITMTALTGNALGDLEFRVKIKNHGPNDVKDYLVTEIGGDGEDVSCTKFPIPGAWSGGAVDAGATDTFDIKGEYTCVFADDGDDDTDVFMGLRFEVSHDGDDPESTNDRDFIYISPST